MADVAAAKAALKVAEAEEALDALREKVHAARDSGGIPPKLAEQWRAANAKAAAVRRAHREAEIAAGRREPGVGLSVGGAS